MKHNHSENQTSAANEAERSGIVLQQKNLPERVTGRSFVMGVAGIVLRLALMQIAVNLLIRASGLGLLNILFYVYAVWLLVAFMRKTVAAQIYTLKRGTLLLEKKLGDSTVLLVEIPLRQVVSVRPVYMGERLHSSYRQVTVIDPKARPGFRMRVAFVASLISAHAARWLAGGHENEYLGELVVYREGGKQESAPWEASEDMPSIRSRKKLSACVFRPDAQMRAALKQTLGKAYGYDERIESGRVNSIYARALQLAFPALYPHVDPLVRPEDVEAAREEIEARSRKKNNGSERKPAAGTRRRARSGKQR